MLTREATHREQGYVVTGIELRGFAIVPAVALQLVHSRFKSGHRFSSAKQRSCLLGGHQGCDSFVFRHLFETFDPLS
jgi:hypothetical protein